MVCQGSWGPGISWVGGAWVGGSELTIASNKSWCQWWRCRSFCLRGSGAETQLSVDWNSFCGQWTWGFVPKTVWWGSESNVLRAKELREWSGSVCKGGRIRNGKKPVSHGAIRLAKSSLNQGEREKVVVLKKWSFCVVVLPSVALVCLVCRSVLY